MSTPFRTPPRTFVKHDDVKLFGANIISVDHAARRKNNNNSVVIDRPSAPLRETHIVFLVVDVLVALHASFKKWRNHRRTLRALADLDEHQLRDIGLTTFDVRSGLMHRRLAQKDKSRALRTKH